MKELFLSLFFVTSCAQGMHNQLRRATIIMIPSEDEFQICEEFSDIIVPQRRSFTFLGHCITWQSFNEVMMYIMLDQATKFINAREASMHKLVRFRALLSHNELCHSFANELYIVLHNFKQNEHITCYEFSQQVLGIAQRFRERLHNRSDSE